MKNGVEIVQIFMEAKSMSNVMKRTMNHLSPQEAQRSSACDAQRGITLIELLVVLSIITLISALVVVNVLPERDRAAVRKARVDVGVIESALDQYRLDLLNYPSNAQGLDALVRAPSNLARPEEYRPGGYLRGGVPLDPWGNPYQYRFPGERGVVDVFSLGADGEEGGEELNADIGNWPINSR